jgi:hypothetical protein
MKFDIGAMSVGDILDRGLKILLARLPTFYLIYLLTLSPLLLYQMLVIPGIQGDPSEPPSPEKLLLLLGGLLGVALMSIILSPIGHAAVLHVIGKEFVDERVGVGEAFSFAFGRFLSLLGTSMLYGLIWVAGYFACCIPAVFVAVFFGFFAQIVVMEGLGGMTALNRSKELVTGFGWRVFAIYLLLILVLGVTQGFLPQVLELLLPAHAVVQTPLGPAPGPIVNFLNFAIQTTIVFLVSILLQSYLAVCTTLLYFDLRIRKEGFDLELAARQQGQRGEDPSEEPG